VVACPAELETSLSWIMAATVKTLKSPSAHRERKDAGGDVPTIMDAAFSIA
jgi:hypothetical protein